MLSELRIQNFAIIDKLELRLSPGFNTITGETGAGKSIIIDAMDVMLGGRTDPDMIRAGEDKAVIEGTFKPEPSLFAEIKPLLEKEGLEAEPELTFTREIRANGRTICRLNGSTVSLPFYREIGQRLVDIHGQSEHLSLLRPKVHVYLLDGFAGLVGKRRELGALVAELSEVRVKIADLEQDEAALARRMDMLKYQVEEIRGVAPKVGEDNQLQEESARLANAEQLATLTAEAAQILDGESADTPAALDMLNQVAAALAKVSRIDPRLQESAELAEIVSEQVAELAKTVRSYVDGVEHNPARLTEVEERLDALNRLKKKYGGTLEAVLAHAEQAAKDLATITNSEAALFGLRAAEEKLLRKIGAAALALSDSRLLAANKLAQGIELELQELKMEGARFTVSLTQEEDLEHGCYVRDRRLKFDSTGIDHVEFMIAANRGEPLRPLVKVASGGETARIMLALKSVLSRQDSTPTLIFDEIDQGIGGRLGTMLGQKLWKLSTSHQVLCVTHLPHLASFADSHFKVAKTPREHRTVTEITLLNDKQRVEELAEMLGAETVSAKQSAHDLLMIARQLKDGKGIQAALL
ncbi:MAG: DNA repair protein RecN [Anaerolinea sp.]|nr:DNA repair protein RecN [Anaerolinea sp.]MCC6975043.1 DNA repair protein RecN [Anaerolineae bacterium]CAG0975620.1 DNA repair protein RecN [Anaerolineae bacterium]